MNTRKVRDVVEAIIDAIKTIKDNGKYSNILVRVELILSLDRLKKELELLKLEHAEEIADRTTLSSLEHEFNIRYTTIIQGTVASYEMVPDSLCNQVYCTVGRMLQDVIGCDLYKLLMPSVEVEKKYKTSKGGLSDLKLHEFVFADDGTPIEVEKALNEYYQNCLEIRKLSPHQKTYNLYHTCKEGNEKVALTQMEHDRVTFHSKQSDDYYAQFCRIRTSRKSKKNFMTLSIITLVS